MTVATQEAPGLAYRLMVKAIEQDGLLPVLMERKSELVVELKRSNELLALGAVATLTGVVTPFRAIPLLKAARPTNRFRSGGVSLAQSRQPPSSQIEAMAQVTAWMRAGEPEETLEYILNRVVVALGERGLPPPFVLGQIRRLGPIPIEDPGLRRGDLEVQITLRTE